MSHLAILIACLSAGLGNTNADEQQSMSMKNMKQSEIQSILDDGIEHLNKMEQQHGSTIGNRQKTRIG